jgi:alpha/beta superfamily hydrolase
LKVERVTFPGSAGGKLAARLDAPDDAPRAHALFAHCFTCGKDVFAASRIAQRLTDHGIAVLRFDFTGLGASEGEFANTNFSSNVADLAAAAAYLRQAHGAPALLIGHSLGGAAVLAAAGDVPESKAVVTIAAPSDPAHVTGLFRDRIPQIEAQGEAEVVLAGRPFRIKRQFLADAAEQKLAEKVARLRRALLVMHSPADATVDIANATRIFTAAKHPKSFVSLNDADHLLSERTHAVYAANVIAAWVEPYV